MDALQRYRFTQSAMQALKSALVAEAVHRRGRHFEQWSAAEAKAVWAASRDFAQQHGLRVPLLEDVVRVERQASGHSDYGSKWALYVVELMLVPVPATA